MIDDVKDNGINKHVETEKSKGRQSEEVIMGV